MNRIIERLSSFGVVPVVALDHSCTAASVAKALIVGGLPCAEITFRTAAAEESIHLIKAAYPDMLIGAGTVTTTGQVDQAINAGAEFIVSPGIDRKLIDYCVKKQIAVIPGCVTPSELMEAVSSGIDVVKFFPAEQCGGVATITALSAPFPQMMFIPTGGINISNIGDYLSAQRVIACGGSWMVKKTLINTGRFDEIQRLTKETVMKVSEERGK